MPAQVPVKLNKWFENILNVFILSGLAYFLTWCIYFYSLHPTYTDIAKTTQNEELFPAITFCPTKPKLKESVLKVMKTL